MRIELTVLWRGLPRGRLIARKSLAAAVLAVLAAAAVPCRGALGEPARIVFSPVPGAVALADGNRAASIVVAASDWMGVKRAAGDLAADLERVSGQRSHVISQLPSDASQLIIAGTLGRSRIIDELVAAGKIDPAAIRGKWEAWISAVVADPAPGVARALVIVGSDKRATIYGLYEVSEQIGVSPWYWWADVAPRHRDALYLAPGQTVHGSPAVKYRGIFLNDEAPDLTRWVAAKFGYAAVSKSPPVPPHVANFGRQFYGRLFEVMLRLRANYLWPAMWSNAFNEDDPTNAALADEYGIVMGTSHQEPMMRAQKEWDRRYLSTLGHWNYASQTRVLEDFWREGIRRNREFENIVTIGLRGANDTPMARGGPEANQALLEHIVDRQRAILAEEFPHGGPPQLWCLYKEVQEYYAHGMRVPDDVILLWSDDNWGNLRRVPSAAERSRPGGAGIYYHFDYHGGPRSYQWINANPLPKIWEQMSRAYDAGADRVWIVNVGHFKGYEIPTEFFLNLAWDPHRWNGTNVPDFERDWAAREFGEAHAGEIADIVATYAKDNGRRKPELLSPSTYSLVNFREAETAVAEFDALARRAEELNLQLPAAQRDAFYELVLFPTRVSALLNRLYFAAGQNALFAAQGRASAAESADETEELFRRFQAMVADFNDRFAGGRWQHFMDQPVLGYTTWQDPPVNSLRAIRLQRPVPAAGAALGVAVEGQSVAWPAAGDGAAPGPTLPQFDAFNRQTHYFEVFNRGAAPARFQALPSADWIKVESRGGEVRQDRRIAVSIDWERAPLGRAEGKIAVISSGGIVLIAVHAFNPASSGGTQPTGFVASAGYVSIEPEHFTGNVSAAGSRWVRIGNYGRTLSGMRAEGPESAAAPSAHLDYKVWLFEGSAVDVQVIAAPSLACVPGQPVRYAVSFDDAPPSVVTLVPAGDAVRDHPMAWGRWATDNAATATSHHDVHGAGGHVLKVWSVDPGVVVQKIVVSSRAVPATYLGPPETVRVLE